MKTKIVVVGYAMGRTGSSALVGMLKHMGLSVICEGKKDKNNKKGYFESNYHKKTLGSIYGAFFTQSIIPPMVKIETKIKLKKEIYHSFIENQCKDSQMIAMKSYRMLDIPFLYQLREQYDIKLIVLNRNTEDQAQSAAKMNRKNKDYYINKIKLWKVFRDKIKVKYPLDRIEMDFYDLIDNPDKTVTEIAKFIGIPKPSPDKIKKWIDKGMVHRNE